MAPGLKHAIRVFSSLTREPIDCSVGKYDETNSVTRGRQIVTCAKQGASRSRELAPMQR